MHQPVECPRRHISAHLLARCRGRFCIPWWVRPAAVCELNCNLVYCCAVIRWPMMCMMPANKETSSLVLFYASRNTRMSPLVFQWQRGNKIRSKLDFNEFGKNSQLDISTIVSVFVFTCDPNYDRLNVECFLFRLCQRHLIVTVFAVEITPWIGMKAMIFNSFDTVRRSFNIESAFQFPSFVI